MSTYQELVELVTKARDALKEEKKLAKALMETLAERVCRHYGIPTPSTNVTSDPVTPKGITLGASPDGAYYETAISITIVLPNQEPQAVMRFPIKLIPQASRIFDVVTGGRSYTINFGKPSTYDSVAEAFDEAIRSQLAFSIDRTHPAPLVPTVFG